MPPQQTLGFQRVIQRAAAHVQSAGKDEILGRNVLVAIFREPDCHAAYLLEQQGITRLDVVSYISHGVSKIGEEPAPAAEGDPDEDDDEDEESAAAPKKDPLALFTSDLVARAAEGKIDPLIGRDDGAGAHGARALPPAQEQSGLRRRSRRRQDGARRRAGAADPPGQGARGVEDARASTRSTWARSSPARAFAATSSSA